LPDPATDERLTILLGCDTFAPDVNGAAKFAERLAEGLIERGHRVVVVAPSDTGVPHEGVETHAGHAVFVYRLRSHRWPLHDWLRFIFPWVARRAVARILDDVKPDAVHFQSHFVVGRALSDSACVRDGCANRHRKTRI
jgi:UDP-N-acetylglucosamine:LPS N-acetylglucosamine transferase